jgi:hypothetical protein
MILAFPHFHNVSTRIKSGRCLETSKQSEEALSDIREICTETYFHVIPNNPFHVALRATYPAVPALTSKFTPNSSLPDVIKKFHSNAAV